MEDAICAFVHQRFRIAVGSRRLSAESPLFSSGVIDSFGLLELIAFLEDAYGVTIDPVRHDLRTLDTPRRIAALITTLHPSRA
jgi:acyl carrier protein